MVAQDGKVPVRPILGLVAIVAIIFSLIHIRGKMADRTEIAETGKLDDKYFAAANMDDFAALKKEYEAMLAKASGPEAKKLLAGRVAGCDAWIAWHDTSNKPNINKYKGAIEKMNKAKELAGDPDGVWAKNIATFEKRLDGALGPKTVQEMQTRFDTDRTQGFDRSEGDLLGLYRWRDIWKEAGLHQGDTAREKLFGELRVFIIAGYSARLESQFKEASKSPISVAAKATPLGTFEQLKLWDAAKAADYERKNAKLMAQVRKAAQIAAQLAEQMKDPSTVMFKE